MMEGLEKQLLPSGPLGLQRLWAKAAVGKALPGSSSSGKGLRPPPSAALAKLKPWDVDKFLNSE